MKKKILKKAIIKELKENATELFYYFKKSLAYLPTLLQIFVPVIWVYYRYSYKRVILYSAVLFFTCRIIRNISIKVNSTTYSGLPIPKHRFTKLDKEARIISLREESEEEAISYLYNLEEKLISRGMLKDVV